MVTLGRLLDLSAAVGSRSHRSRNGPVGALVPPQDPLFDHALECLADARVGPAFEAFAALADAGDARAARIALMLGAQSVRLYGRRCTADPARRRRWRTVIQRVG